MKTMFFINFYQWRRRGSDLFNIQIPPEIRAKTLKSFLYRGEARKISWTQHIFKQLTTPLTNSFNLWNVQNTISDTVAALSPNKAPPCLQCLCHPPVDNGLRNYQQWSTREAVRAKNKLLRILSTWLAS